MEETSRESVKYLILLCVLLVGCSEAKEVVDNSSCLEYYGARIGTVYAEKVCN